MTAATIDESDRPGKLEAADIDEEALLAEYEAEKPARRLSGSPRLVVQAMGVGLSLFALYWVFNPMPAQFYLPLPDVRPVPMTFLVYRGWGRSDAAKAAGKSDNPHILDWLLAVGRWSRSPTSSRTGSPSSAAQSCRPTSTWSWDDRDPGRWRRPAGPSGILVPLVVVVFFV